jgi:uncharacterized protein YecT (DUF1311 family)
MQREMQQLFSKLPLLQLLLIMAVLLCSSSVASAQTQAEMDQQAGDTYAKADADLNSVYKQVLSEYKSNKLFIKKLRKAEQKWIAFRDAQMQALYPQADTPGYYGTVFPVCWESSLTELTKQRTETLQRWLDGVEEGDACRGSIRFKR